jgi:SAM-dependent methyltransferase
MTPDQFTAASKKFRALEASTRKRFVLEEKNFLPILNEDTAATGFDRHYLYHPAWALRALKRIQPSLHYDFGSILSFVAAASAWFPVRFCEIRPAAIQLDGLSVGKEDLMRLSMPDNSIESLSCLHVVEHIGLGRYGDDLDYDGDLKAVKELKRVARPGGDILFAVPLGRTALIQYNAHRVFTWESVLEMFGDDVTLVESALIPEQTGLGLVYSPTKELLDLQNHACGCFWFRKK